MLNPSHFRKRPVLASSHLPPAPLARDALFLRTSASQLTPPPLSSRNTNLFLRNVWDATVHQRTATFGQIT